MFACRTLAARCQQARAWGLLIGCLVMLVAGFQAGSPALALSDTWRLDPEHADIRFTWNHLGVSRQSGTFTEVFGALTFTPTNPTGASVEASALVASLSTGVAALDKVLKSPDYFDAKRYPRVRFVGSKIVPTGAKTANVSGTLTIKGVSKPVEFDVTWNFTGKHPLAAFNPIYRGQWVSGFTARAVIKRSEWGISRSAPLVSDEIEIEINAEFLAVQGD